MAAAREKVVADAKKLIAAGVPLFDPDEGDILRSGRDLQIWIINLSSQHDSLEFLRGSRTSSNPRLNAPPQRRRTTPSARSPSASFTCDRHATVPYLCRGIVFVDLLQCLVVA